MADSWVITFPSVYFVMKAERLLKAKGWPVELIPIPREISPDCGVALEIFDIKIDQIKEFLAKNSLVPEVWHKEERR